MRHNISIDLTIRFTSKWHTGSGEGSFMVNRLIRRDARYWPYIPGSTLKGVTRESCEKLSRTLGFDEPADPHQTDLKIPGVFEPLNKVLSPVDRIFGNNFEGGNLFFRDARLKKEPAYGFLKEESRICMYRKLGTAREKHLFSTQYAAPMVFTTTIDGHHDDLFWVVETDPPYAYCLLIAGIMSIERIGGDKSTGSGQVEMKFDSIKYNDNPVAVERVFDYLDSDLYSETR